VVVASTSSRMQHIPLKTSQYVDIAGPLRRWMDSEHDYGQDCGQLQRMRGRAGCVQALTTTGKAHVEEYLSQIRHLQPLLALPESAGADVLRPDLSFTWTDALDNSKEGTNDGLEFERAALEYNYAALASMSAAQQDLSEAEGLKSASHLFQVAAGGFDSVREFLAPRISGSVTSDLTDSGLRMASCLMLAQAQSLYYEKAEKGMKPGIVAKLACEASHMFSHVRELAQSPNLASCREGGWAAKADFQRVFFMACAQWHQGRAELAVAEEIGSGYAKIIARWTLAEVHIAEAMTIASRHSLGMEFTRPLTTLRAMLTKEKAQLVKDNRDIYLETAVDASTLAAVERVCAVKALPLPPPPPCPADKLLFKDLLPPSARAALQGFQLEAKLLAKRSVETAAETEATTKAHLSSLGLPGSLEAHESNDGISDAVWSKVEFIQQVAGGVGAIADQVGDLQSGSQRARSIMDHISVALQEEESRDASFRSRYAASYRGVPVEALTGDLRRDVNHYRSLWEQAQERDRDLMGRLEASQELMALLNLTRDALDGLLPANDEKLEGGTPEMSALSQLLIQIAGEIKKLQAAVSQVSSSAEASDLRSLLAQAAGESVDMVIEAKLQSLQGLVTSIENSAGKTLPPLLSQVDVTNRAFTEARNHNSTAKAREAFLNQISEAVEEYHSARSRLSEGGSFYGDLLRRLAQLNQTVEDMIYTQGLARRDFEVNFSRNASAAAQAAKDAEMARKLAEEDRPADPPAGSNPFAPSPPAGGASNSSSSRSYPSVTSAPEDPAVQSLVEMGFDVGAVKQALRETQGDKQAAIAKLVSL
jgi:programmed cell death 6-interacting protein